MVGGYLDTNKAATSVLHGVYVLGLPRGSTAPDLLAWGTPVSILTRCCQPELQTGTSLTV